MSLWLIASGLLPYTTGKPGSATRPYLLSHSSPYAGLIFVRIRIFCCFCCCCCNVDLKFCEIQFLSSVARFSVLCFLLELPFPRLIVFLLAFHLSSLLWRGETWVPNNVLLWKWNKIRKWQWVRESVGISRDLDGESVMKWKNKQNENEQSSRQKHLNKMTVTFDSLDFCAHSPAFFHFTIFVSTHIFFVQTKTKEKSIFLCPATAKIKKMFFVCSKFKQRKFLSQWYAGENFDFFYPWSTKKTSQCIRWWP